MSAKAPERLRDIDPHIPWDEHLKEWNWMKEHWYIWLGAFAFGLLLAYLAWG